VKLLQEDIRTTEVFEWQGVHLLHFMGSSCSQKTRIFLNLKGIDWQSHHVDLAQQQNYTEWFMGINPRGLVPVLVDNGDVIIESNDILEHLEAEFPEPSLIPRGMNSIAHELLQAEDNLHLDLRALSMRYVFPSDKAMRNDDALASYRNHGSGTVGGKPDAHKAVELDFYKSLQQNNGVTDEQVQSSVSIFRATYDELSARVASSQYLLGDKISLIDIAWYIYSVRLLTAGYPLHRLHARVGDWFDALNKKPEFLEEVQEPPPLLEMRKALHSTQESTGTSLIQVAGL
jgi:glutathione S-transferase